MNAFAPIAVCIPLVGAALLVAIFARISRVAVEIFATLTAVSTLVLCCVILADIAVHGSHVVWFGGWHPGNIVGLGIAFVVDPAGAAVAACVAAIVTGAIVFARQYFDDVGAIFYVLLLAMLGSMVAFAYAADAFDLFVFYEIFSVAAYALSAYRVEMKAAYQGSFQFALVSSVAGLFILAGIMMLEGRTGQLNLAAIGDSLRAQHASLPFLAVVFTFIAIGLFTRGALVPLHFWFDEVHASAPTPLCVVLSGAMAPLALFGFLRLYLVALSPALPPSAGPSTILFCIGALSAIIGSVMCLRQVKLKRMLAFMTVAHAGVATAAFSAFTVPAVAGAAQYLVGYAFGVAGLFMAVAVVRSVTGEAVDLFGSAGAGRRLVITGTVFLLGTCEAAGLWPSARAIAASTPGWHSLAIVALFTIVGGATGGACLRAFRTIFVLRSANAGPNGNVPWFMLVPASLLVLVPMLVAFAPGEPSFVLRSATELLDVARYRALTLDGTVAALPVVEDVPTSSLSWLAALSSLIVAFLCMSPQRALRIVRVAVGRNAAIKFLADVHDGDVGAYVAWITGTVTLATGLVLVSR